MEDVDMAEKRCDPRMRVLKAGTIAFGAAAIDCAVRNVTASGALLEVESPADISPVLEEIGKLAQTFGSLEAMGMAANFVVQLRNSLDILRRAVLRIYRIQRVEFVPSVHVLVRTLVVSIVVMMPFLKTEGDPTSAIIFDFISYMFVYALYLVRLLEQPFAKGHGPVDDVSVFLLDELEKQLRDAIGHSAAVRPQKPEN